MRHLVREAGLEHAITVSSAGTIAHHAGEPPDARSRAAAQARGITVAGQARRWEAEDWARHDYVLAMDRNNLRDLSESCPSPEAQRKLSLLLRFDPDSPPDASVPDPYYGGPEGFDRVLDLCLAGCRGLLAHLRREHGL